MVIPGILPITVEKGVTWNGEILQCKDEKVSVTGTLVPDVTGLYVPSGSYNGHQLYILEGSPASFLYVHPISGNYIIAQTLSDAPFFEAWGSSPPLDTEPSGSYIPFGTATGLATVTDHPTDLTGMNPLAYVRRRPDQKLILDLQPFISSLDDAEITIPGITRDVTGEWPSSMEGTYQWDLVFTNGVDVTSPYLRGPFVITNDVITK